MPHQYTIMWRQSTDCHPVIVAGDGWGDPLPTLEGAKNLLCSSGEVNQVAASNLPPTRIEYFELLVDECLRDYSSMQRCFIEWAEEHVPHWQALGMREEHRRLRIELARSSYVLCQQLKAEGATPGQIRKRLRMRHEDVRSEGLDLYDLMLQRMDETEPPHYGTTDD